MKLIAQCCLLALATAVEGSKGGVHRRDVCVLGSGPSGLYSAHVIQQHGQTVSVFEKESYISKKTHNDDPGDGREYFHHFLTSSMTLAQELITKYSLESSTEANPTGDTYLPNGVFPFPAPEPTPGQQMAVQMAFQKYLSIIAEPTFARQVYDVTNLKDLPAELTEISFLEWLQVNELEILYPVFYGSVTLFGYGEMSTTPAIYLLKYLNFGTIMDILTEKVRYWNADRLMHALADDLDEYHQLNVDIYRSKEGKNGERTLYYNQNGKKRHVQCGKVVVAYPQALDKMEFLNLGEEQKEVFGQVVYERYSEILVDGFTGTPIPTNLNDGERTINFNRLQFLPNTVRNPTVPVLISRMYGDNEIAQCFMDTDHLDVEEDTLKSHVVNFLNNMGPTPATSRVLTVDDVKTVTTLNYFPRVGSNSFKNGFFQKLDNIQGKNGLYYVGGLTDFELIDNSMKSAAAILAKHMYNDN
eukprot:Awhi_evm1s13663